MSAFTWLEHLAWLVVAILAYRVGLTVGVRRGRTAIVTFFSRTSFVLRAGEPGPMTFVLNDPGQAASLAAFLDHESDVPWLRARFAKPRRL